MPTLVDTATGVTLRAHREADIANLVEMARDPETIRWTTIPPGYTQSHAESFLAQVGDGWRDQSSFIWAIANDAGEFVGQLDLRPASARVASVGFVMHPAYRGQGVMRSGLRLVVDYGFDVLGLRLIQWQARMGNFGSWWTTAAVGFAFEGAVRGGLFEQGHHFDMWSASLTPEMARSTKVVRPPELTFDGGRWRLLELGDADRIVEACADPDLQYWLPGLPNPYAAVDARQFIEESWTKACARSTYHGAVVDEQNVLRAVLGVVSPFENPELGYWTHPDSRGQRWLVRAGEALLRWARDHELGPVLLRHGARNEASAKVAAQLGFSEFGCFPLAKVYADGPQDLVYRSRDPRAQQTR